MKEKVISALSATGLKKDEIENLIETPKDSKFGDYSFPCFALSKAQKKNPADIAKSLALKIKSADFEKVEAVGPYINFFIKKESLADDALKKILSEREKYGSERGKSSKVMVEFSQANTHKAFHIGHIRGTSLGESLSRIMEFSGDKVIRANYQGDTGMHVAKWLWCYGKYHSKEKLRKDESWIASIYVEAVKKLAENEFFQSEVEELNRKLDTKEDKKLNELWKKTRQLSLDSLEGIYKDLDTKFDKYFFESELEQRAKEIVKELLSRGIAEMSEGAAIINLEKYNLGVWVLLRKDGTVLYSAKDLALAEKKFNDFDAKEAVYVVGSEQNQHIHQLFKTLELMKFKQAEKCRYIPVSLVRLPTGKMSSRTGDNILYSAFKKDLIEYAKSEISKREKLNQKELEKRALAIAIASLKYAMLKQDANKTIIFDKHEALNFEGNTGAYLLYSYARAKSILRKVKKIEKYQKIPDIKEKEKALISKMSLFPEIVKHSREQLAPNITANYAYELSQAFNEFYHSSQVIGSEQEPFRISLVEAFCIVLKNALNLLAIKVIEKM